MNSFDDVKIMNHNYPELLYFMYLYFVFTPPQKKTLCFMMLHALALVLCDDSENIKIFAYRIYLYRLCFATVKRNLRTALRIVYQGYNVMYSFYVSKQTSTLEKTIPNTFSAINVILTCGFITCT
jgi:hypothetical protein